MARPGEPDPDAPEVRAARAARHLADALERAAMAERAAVLLRYELDDHRERARRWIVAALAVGVLCLVTAGTWAVLTLDRAEPAECSTLGDE